MTATDIDYETLAQEAEGNWMKFSYFCWHWKPPDAEKWTLVYTHNRDSGLTSLSNAAAIDKELKRYIGTTVMQEDHTHWANGWVKGYAIRVYKKGTKKLTAAFKKWCDIQARLEDYPLLDEEDHSRREYEDTCQNIESQASRMAGRVGYSGIELPEDHVQQLFDWFWANDQNAVTAKDDSGGYPSDEEMEAAFIGLDWAMECEECYCLEKPTHEHCRYCHRGFEDGVVVHPIEEWRFCSCGCFAQGYGGEVEEL